jgi:hypothetical protein
MIRWVIKSTCSATVLPHAGVRMPAVVRVAARIGVPCCLCVVLAGLPALVGICLASAVCFHMLWCVLMAFAGFAEGVGEPQHSCCVVAKMSLSLSLDVRCCEAHLLRHVQYSCCLVCW